MNKRSPYQTIAVLVFACIVIYLFYPVIYILWFALILSVVSVSSLSVAYTIEEAWLGLAKLLGTITSTILLTLIYLLILVPFSVLFRKKLSINLKKKKDSYFIIRNHKYVKSDLENLW